MQDTPAPEGDIQPVEKGPEPLSQLPAEGREPLAGPRQSEAEKPRETGVLSQKPPTPAKAEAQSAGGQVAKDLFGTGPAEISGQAPSEPPRPATRRVQPFMQSARRYTAVRQAGLEQAGLEKKAT